jgi:hypothetical protein
MKERPILFSAPMVRALLDGSKTQTRRQFKARGWAAATLKALEFVHVLHGAAARVLSCAQPVDTAWAGFKLGADSTSPAYFKCPYGQPGDRLWVRESGVRSLLVGMGDQMGMFRHDVPATSDTGRWWIESTRAPGASYNAVACTRQAALLGASAKVCPSIHMPRWASRILLEIVSVRVERLNDCSEADAVAEGCTKNHNGYYWGGPHPVSGTKQMATARKAYCDLWESINGAGSWAANPWVWVVEFKRVAT